VAAVLYAGLCLVVVGCGTGGKGDAKGTGGKGAEVAKKDGDAKGTEVAKGDSKHEGWWCDEHGVPEAECSMCSAKVAKECKAKGDWCDKHDRAKSQCFICDPKLRDKYNAVYKAKTGKDMPEPTENGGKKEEKK
jgi:hypothetical protein